MIRAESFSLLLEKWEPLILKVSKTRVKQIIHQIKEAHKGYKVKWGPQGCQRWLPKVVAKGDCDRLLRKMMRVFLIRLFGSFDSTSRQETSIKKFVQCMDAKSFEELCATTLNMMANIFMVFKMCQDTAQKVPKGVICCQVLANVFWFIYAHTRNDYYLMTTSGSSLFLQSVSLFMLVRKQDPPKKFVSVSNKIELSTSNDTLMRF
jgi:hypothetical protein